MNLKKRGISTVVANVLIILLVLAAVAIIWAFIRPVITSTSEQISADCLTIDLEIESCQVSGTCTGGESNCYDIRVKRNAGKGDLRELRFIFELTDESSRVVPNPSSLGELESLTYTLLYGGGIIAATSVDVAAVIKGEIVCNPIKAIVSCGPGG
ncbi:MAG: hypothetical protein IIA87_01660 [Nanoarchaeota archaeon]|nr:hypothetical protein [Nanoarchaeota archaeon]